MGAARLAVVRGLDPPPPPRAGREGLDPPPPPLPLFVLGVRPPAEKTGSMSAAVKPRAARGNNEMCTWSRWARRLF